MMRRHKNDIREIVIHCAATPNGFARYTAKDIDQWHKDKGFLRDQGELALCSSDFFHIGYHFIIDIDGNVERGRHLLETGAHGPGHNYHSLGICLIGTDAFTAEQWKSLSALKTWLESIFGPLKKLGHRQFCERRRARDGCPGFDVERWVKDRYVPQPKHICNPRRDS